jgi:hypothetical protein
MSANYVYASLSLIGLCALAGAGVGIGSGVAMISMGMAAEEQKQQQQGAVLAHSPLEKKGAISTGFAASGASGQ